METHTHTHTHTQKIDQETKKMYFYDIEMLYKAANTSKSLLNDINQIVYSLYRAKKILKKYTIVKSIPIKSV